MNQITAHPLGQKDAGVFIERLATMQSPEQIENNYVRFVAQRIQGVDKPSARVICRALMAPPNAPALSIRIKIRTEAMLAAATSTLKPEAMRSLLLWLIGSEKVGPGFSQIVLEAVMDRGTNEAMSTLQAAAVSQRNALDLTDKNLFVRQIKRLSRGHRKIASGMMRQAKFSYESGDAERYRTKLETARAFIEKHAPHTDPAAQSRRPRSRQQPAARR